MIRYTFNHMSGKFAPYIQLGYQHTLMVSSKLEYNYLVHNIDSPIPDYDNTKYTAIATGTDDDISSQYSNLIGGFGVGYSVLPKQQAATKIHFLPLSGKDGERLSSHPTAKGWTQ